MSRPVVEKVVRDVFATAFAPTRVATERPSDLTDEVIVVERIGGGDGSVFDRPVLDVEVFAPTRARAFELAEDIRDFIRDGSLAAAASPLTFVTSRTVSAPSQVPYDNAATVRVAATYSLTAA